MSDELAMEMIEKLSEELGEKELKIMALEKELEEQKKEKLEYYDLCKIKEFKIMWYEEISLEEDDGEFCPQEIVFRQFYNAKYNGGDDEIMIKTILHYFGGSIMTKAEIIEDLDDFGDCDFEEYVEDQFEIIDLQNGKYWVSDDK